MSIKDCIKQLETLDPADAVVFEKHRKTLNEGGVTGGDAYTQAAELTMESILGERNDLATEIRDKGGMVESVTIENLLNPASYSAEPVAEVEPESNTDIVKNATWYHGTSSEFEDFSLDYAGSSTEFEGADEGIFFSTNPDDALSYGNLSSIETEGTPKTIPVKLNVENILEVTFGGTRNKDTIKKAKEDGYDAVFEKESGHILVFDPSSITRLDLTPAEETKPPEGVKEETGLYLGYEVPTDTGKTDSAVREDKEGQRDLFTKPGISGKKARDQSADTFNIVYEQREVGTIQSSFDHIKNPGHAAHLFASIRKHAQETFMVAVTDDKGKILNVIRHTIGTRDAASVHPVDVVGAIAATEGGTQYWLAHNHPSGYETPSNQDKAITEIIIRATEGLGVAFQGHIVIAGVKYADAMTGVTLGKIPPGPRGKKIPITERRLKRKAIELYPAISDSDHSKKFVTELNTQSGILLTNQRHVPVGVIALTSPEMAKLKDGKQVRRILSALDKTNASAIIIFDKTTYDVKAIKNLTDYVSRVKGLRHLDTLVTEKGVLISLADRHLTVGEPDAPFFSRPEKDRKGHSEKTVRGWLKAPLRRVKGVDVEIVADMETLRKHYPGREIPEIAGMFARKWKGTGDKILIIASNVRNKRDAHEVLAHELVGHLGLERLLGQERFARLLNEISLIKDKALQSPGSHPEVEEAVAQIKRSYTNKKGEYTLNREQEATEILAHIAENRQRIGAFAELYNKILNWVRNVLSKWGLINVTRVNIGRGEESIEDLLEVAVLNLRGKAPVRGGMKPDIKADTSLARTVLPMDKASRLARAKEQGFDVSRVMYHGTNFDFDAFEPAAHETIKKYANQGIYFTDKPSLASLYANKSVSADLGSEGGRVIPVYLRYENPLVVDPKMGLFKKLLLLRKIARDPASLIDIRLERLGSAFISTQEVASLKEAGYDAIVNKSLNEVVIFDPSQVRSVNADFDPAMSDSADIMAMRIGDQTELFPEPEDIKPLKSRKGLGHKEASKRVPELQNSMADLMSGKAAISEYDRMVNEHKPVDPYDYVPVPATPKEMRKALSSNKIGRIGAPAKELAPGAKVGLRLDIPAYTNHGIWVVAIHGQTGGFDAGKVYGYDNIARIENATFGSREKTAQKVAAGGPKSTMAVIKGEWVPITQDDAHRLALEALTNDNWTQVGFDPERHSYFWDRHDMRPVVSADDVVQIGPLVMAKNPKYAPKDDFLYARRSRKPRKNQNGAAYRIAGAIKGAYGTASTPLKRQVWGLLSLRQMAEQIRPLIPTIHEDYLRYYRRMETTRNVYKSRAGDIAGQRRKLNNFQNDQLSRVQHESTIAGVDGDVPYEAIIGEVEAAEQIAVINAQIRGRTGQDTGGLMARIKEIRFKLKQEENRRRVSRFILAEFNKLNDTQKEIYRLERDYHVDLREAQLEALLERIGDAFVDESIKGDMMTRLRLEYEQSTVQPPYFPLARFGEFWVYSEIDGEPYYDMFETEGEWKRHHAELVEAGDKILGRGKSQTDAKPRQEVPPAFIGRIDKILSTLGDHPRIHDIRDEVYQLYLESLPELSARKHAIHRSKMRGFYQDHLRAFAHAAQHGSNMLARIKYGHKLQAVIDDAKLALNMAQTTKTYNAMREELDAYTGFMDENIDDMTEAQIKTEALRLRNAAEREAALQMELDPDQGSAPLYRRWLMYLKIKRQVGARRDHLVGDLKSTADAVEERIHRRAILLGMADNINRQKDPMTALRQVDDVLAELQKSHNDIVNPQIAPWANNMNAIGFTMYLGFTPAAGVVNLMQTPTVALPVMAARYGWVNSAKHMGQITAAITKQLRKDKDHPYWSVEKLLKNDGEIAAFKRWHDEGMLDKTLAHDLQGISEEGIYTGQVKHRVMNAASFIFHQAERMNREITALATYRAAIDKGLPPLNAARAAENIVWKTHFDYSQGNRPRVMRGNVLRVVTQFKQYSQNITYLYLRTAQQAFGKGTKENKEARQEGKRMLFNMLLMQFLMAGILGWPLVELAIMIAQMFDDDDAAEDYKGNFQQWAHEKFGEREGTAFTKGVPNALGIDMHSRLTLSDIWWRSSDRELQGSRRREEILKLILGPVFGSMPLDAHRAFEQVAQAEDFWEYMRALEMAAPKIFKDISKGIRYSQEGLKNLSGVDIMSREDIGTADSVIRAFGFSPAEISRAYDAKGAIERTATRRKFRKRHITNRFRVLFEAKLKADREKITVDGLLGKLVETEFMVEEWNKKNPENQIDIRDQRATIKRNFKESLNMKYGVRSTDESRDLIKKYSFGGQ